MSPSSESADRELLEDVCDIHLHLGPDVYERYADEITVAKQAQKAGYRALLFKNHHFPTASRAELVAQSAQGIEVFGGLVLNSTVGGINKHAVSAAIDFGAKEIWMPTLYSKFHLDLIGEPNWPYPRVRPPVYRPLKTKGITIMNKDGELISELYDILDMIATAEIILSTGHLSIQESKILVKEAAKTGVKKIVFTHTTGLETKLTRRPGKPSRNPNLKDLQELVALGVYLEWDYASTLDPFLRTPRLMAKGIKRFGAEKCLIVSDLGQAHNPNPVEGMQTFIKSLMSHGISEKEINTLVKENPRKLLGIG
jgi:hypothetical protein